jgi:hypothetical protein
MADPVPAEVSVNPIQPDPLNVPLNFTLTGTNTTGISNILVFLYDLDAGARYPTGTGMLTATVTGNTWTLAIAAPGSMASHLAKVKVVAMSSMNEPASAVVHIRFSPPPP